MMSSNDDVSPIQPDMLPISKSHIEGIPIALPVFIAARGVAPDMPLMVHVVIVDGQDISIIAHAVRGLKEDRGSR